MTQDTLASGPMAKKSDGAKIKDNKRDKNFQTKVVIRRLPPSMTEPQFVEQVSPVPPNDYFHFVKADLSLGIHAFTRAYLNFLSQEDVFIFKDKFDGYVFIDTKGNEYSAIVEFAPFQKIPKRRSKKRDAKCGTLSQDPEYLKFLASLENPDEAEDITSGAPPSAETYLEEIEARERDLKENGGAPKQTTPLIEYLKQRKLERQRVRDEKREERKKRELEKKKARDEERRKKKSTSNNDKYDNSDSHSNRSGHYYSKDSKKESDSAGVKLTLLKNPERDDTRSMASSSRGSSSSQHGTSYHDTYPNRDRNDRSSGGKQRNRDDGERFDRYHKGNRDRGDRNTRDKDHDGDKNKEIKDRTEYAKEKYNKEEKGYLSRRERERQREKVAAARERERSKLQKEKEDKKSSKSTDTQKVKGFASKKENSSFVTTSIAQEMTLDDPAIVAAAIEKPKPSSSNNEGGSSSSTDGKDPRVDRRIRNKDRPSLEIYRPGMRRLCNVPSQGGSSKTYQSENNSQNNSGENTPRSCSPSNEGVYEDDRISECLAEEPIDHLEDNSRLSDGDNE